MLSQKDAIQNQKESRGNPCDDNVNVKVFVITLANASTDPWAMMIMDRDADVAGVAVKDSWGFDNHTSWAFFTNDIFFVF